MVVFPLLCLVFWGVNIPYLHLVRFQPSTATITKNPPKNPLGSRRGQKKREEALRFVAWRKRGAWMSQEVSKW